MISWTNYFGSPDFVSSLSFGAPATLAERTAAGQPLLGGWDIAPATDFIEARVTMRGDLAGQLALPPAFVAMLGMRGVHTTAIGAARELEADPVNADSIPGWGGAYVGIRRLRERGAWWVSRPLPLRPSRERAYGALSGYGAGTYATNRGRLAYAGGQTLGAINANNIICTTGSAAHVKASQIWIGPGVPYLPHHAAQVDAKNEARGERAFAGALLAAPGERESYREMQLRYLIPEEWYIGFGGLSDLVAMGPGVEVVCVIDPTSQSGGISTSRHDLIHGLLTGITAVRHARRGAVNYSVTLTVSEAV